MSELNLRQIIERLATEFAGETRKLVFWYDDKAEFEEDMDSVELENAKVYKLEKDNQFYTKYFLEREDTTTNFLIYAPFPKPEVKDNHLEDTMLYSKRFFADRASLLSVDLGIEEKYKHVIEKHIKFFANKERTQRFYDLEIENFNEENILVGLLSAVCKTRICSFEEVLRIVITEDDLENNKFLDEMSKYELLDSFWKLCEQHLGYMDTEPSLERLIVTLFVTYSDRFIQGGVPNQWRSFVSMKQGSIIAFLDNFMNSIVYKDDYDRLSKIILAKLNGEKLLAQYKVEDLLQCDSFAFIDSIVLKWLSERLVEEDISAKLGDYNILQVCELREKMHFGEAFIDEYQLTRNAYEVIRKTFYEPQSSFKGIVEQYRDEDWLIDRGYRKFYYYLDKLNDSMLYDKLRQIVENTYTNVFLGKIIPKWNDGLVGEDGLYTLPLQRDFYNRNIKNIKERTAVIISDAMRYEVGRELLTKLKDDPKCTAEIEPMMSPLPSYTRLGMAALLPHNKLELRDDYEVYADDVLCNDLAGRQQVLQAHCQNSLCVQFDELKDITDRDELRTYFTGKQVVYIYHNQIDAIGDKAATENEVFDACEKAVNEIVALMHKISRSANTQNFIVTADHGFIYKRDKVTESDKIGGVSTKDAWVNRRFIVSKNAITEDGVMNYGLGAILGNDDNKVVSFPAGSNVFKVPGGGQNYVHGGSSPQEMIVPVIKAKVEKGHVETKPATISLVSIVQKITNLITSMDFIQSEPVGDTVTATTYRLVFMSEDDERISNENSYVADSREKDSSKRMFRMKFNFKNQKYDKNKQYYLVVTDDASGIELFRHPVMMDLTFADDFGF